MNDKRDQLSKHLRIIASESIREAIYDLAGLDLDEFYEDIDGAIFHIVKPVILALKEFRKCEYEYLLESVKDKEWVAVSLSMTEEDILQLKADLQKTKDRLLTYQEERESMLQIMGIEVEDDDQEDL